MVLGLFQGLAVWEMGTVEGAEGTTEGAEVFWTAVLEGHSQKEGPCL